MPAIRFILGRAGSGKTHHCFDTIEQWSAQHRLRTKAFFLVPNQATFMTERQLAARNAHRSLLGVRVVSFDTLAREVAGAALAESATVNSRDRRLLIAMAIQQRAADLEFFSGAQSQPHLPGRIGAALAEIDQAGHSVSDLLTKYPSDSPTGRKLRDLHLIQQQYQVLLTDRLDIHRQQQRLLDAIATSPLLADSLVVVDGFAGFSAIQRQILVALARRVARMDIALLIDGSETSNLGEMDLFHRTAETLRQLRADFAAASIGVAQTLLAPAGHRFNKHSLAHLERALAGAPCPTPEAPEPATLIEATSELEEVRGAARQIRKWLHDGMRLRHIGVLCRDLNTYAQWIRPIFAEHGIPFFLDQRRGLSHHPLVRYLRTAIEIAILGCKQQLVLDFLKCGLVPLQPAEIDLLENFVLRHGITHDGWQGSWDFLSSPATEDDTPDMARERRESLLCDEYRRRAFPPLDAIRELASAEPSLVVRPRGCTSVSPQALSVFVQAIESLLSEDSHALQTLRQWIAKAAPEEAQEHEQCLTQLQELLGATKRLLGEQMVSFDQFALILLSAMDGLEARLTPPTLDQVLIGQIDRSRSPEYRCVILLGLNEGSFPAGFAEDTIFSDNERTHLRNSGIELDAGSLRKTLDERLLAYVALTRASDQLVLSRPIADEQGRERTCSSIVEAVRAAIGVTTVAANGSALAEAFTPAQLAGIVGAWRRAGAKPHPAISAAHAFLASSSAPEPVRSAWNVVRAALEYRNIPKLDAQCATSLLNPASLLSVTRLEHFTACAFRHFAGDMLRLESRDVAEVSDLDLGNAFHGVLEHLGRQIIDEKLDWSRAVLEKRLDEMLELVAKDLHNEVLLSSARNQYLVSVVRRMLDRVVDDQEKLQKGGSYRLHCTELSFGRRGDPLRALELTTPAGRTVRICGRIDRIDKDVDRESYVVFDYKRQGRQLKLEDAQCGLALQLLSYLLVLRDNAMPADGSLYLPLMRKMESCPIPTAEQRSDGVQAKPRGIFSRCALDHLDPGLQGPSRLYGARVNKDGDLGAGDCIEDEQFDAMLEAARKMLGVIAGEILSGRIDVNPYQIGTRSPCPYCDFRAVCRMDTSTNAYRQPLPIVDLCQIAKGGKTNA